MNLNNESPELISGPQTVKSQKLRPKFVLPSLFTYQQYGCIKNSNFGPNLMETKSQESKTNVIVKEIGEQEWSRHEIEDRKYIKGINVLKGYDDTMYASWHTKNELNPKSFVGDIRHFLSASPFSGYAGLGLKLVDFNVIDLCKSYIQPRGSILAIGNSEKGTGIATFITPESESPEDEVVITDHSIKMKTRLWSCTSNEFTNTYACGQTNYISYIDSENKVMRKHMPGNVRAVEYDTVGGVLFAGTELGEFVVVDQRWRERSFENKLCSEGIDELRIIFDANFLVSGLKGMLCKYDVRISDVVAIYEGHVHSPKKTPFSYSKEFNMVCATGGDGIIRLWSGDGGRPINEYQPEDPSAPSHGWLISKKNTCMLYRVNGTKIHMHKISY